MIFHFRHAANLYILAALALIALTDLALRQIGGQGDNGLLESKYLDNIYIYKRPVYKK